MNPPICGMQKGMIEGLALHISLSSSSSFLRVCSMGRGKRKNPFELFFLHVVNTGTLMSSRFVLVSRDQVSSLKSNLVSSDLEILQVSILGLMFTSNAEETAGTFLGTLM